MTLMSENARPLPLNTLIEGGIAAFENACRLCEDANILLACARWPTAHSLAVLALEEFGKHMSFMSYVFDIANHRTTRASFLKRMADHRAKLMYARGFLMSLEGRIPRNVVDGLRSSSHSDAALKLRGLYVDVHQETILMPTEGVSAEEATAFVADVTALLGVQRHVWLNPDIRNVLLQESKEQLEPVPFGDPAIISEDMRMWFVQYPRPVPLPGAATDTESRDGASDSLTTTLNRLKVAMQAELDPEA